MMSLATYHILLYAYGQIASVMKDECFERHRHEVISLLAYKLWQTDTLSNKDAFTEYYWLKAESILFGGTKHIDWIMNK